MSDAYHVGQIILVDGQRSVVVEASRFFYEAIPVNTVYWSIASQDQALAQGWGIFEVAGKLEIQRFDESERFLSDAVAYDYVKNSGDELCRRAISYLLLHNMAGEACSI